MSLRDIIQIFVVIIIVILIILLIVLIGVSAQVLEHKSDAFFQMKYMNEEEQKLFDPSHGYFK